MRTYIIDGNFLGIRVLSVHPELRFKENYEQDRQEVLKYLCDHVRNEVIKCSEFIDNIVCVQDHHSWRKSYPIIRPDTDEVHNDYKANRLKSQEEIDEGPDMGKFFSILREFFQGLSDKFDVSFTCAKGAEGDDAIWAWSEYLHRKGKYSLIYCTDSDINQILNFNTAIYRQVKTKLSPTLGQVMLSKNYYEYYKNQDSAGIFDVDLLFWQSENQLLFNRKFGESIFTPNPYWSIFKKMFCGDAKDNVPPCAIWSKTYKSSGRTITTKLTEKQLEDILNDIFGYSWETVESYLYDEELHRNIIHCMMKQYDADMNVDKALKIVEQNRKLLYLSNKEIPKEVMSELKKSIISQCDKVAKLSQMKNQNHMYSAFGLSQTSFWDNADIKL